MMRGMEQNQQLASPGKPALVIPPIWFWRVVFISFAVILLADALTRYRPQFRPLWFGAVAVGFEAFLGVAFLVIGVTSRMQTPTAAKSEE